MVVITTTKTTTSMNTTTSLTGFADALNVSHQLPSVKSTTKKWWQQMPEEFRIFLVLNRCGPS